MTHGRSSSSLRRGKITLDNISIDLSPIKSLLSFLSIFTIAIYNISEALGNATSTPIYSEIHHFEFSIETEDLVQVFIGDISCQLCHMKSAHWTWCSLPGRSSSWRSIAAIPSSRASAATATASTMTSTSTATAGTSTAATTTTWATAPSFWRLTRFPWT